MVHERSPAGQKWPGSRPPSEPSPGLRAAWAECGFSLKAEVEPKSAAAGSYWFPAPPTAPPQVLLEARAQVYTPHGCQYTHTLCSRGSSQNRAFPYSPGVMKSRVRHSLFSLPVLSASSDLAGVCMGFSNSLLPCWFIINHNQPCSTDLRLYPLFCNVDSVPKYRHFIMWPRFPSHI